MIRYHNGDAWLMLEWRGVQVEAEKLRADPGNEIIINKTFKIHDVLVFFDKFFLFLIKFWWPRKPIRNHLTDASTFSNPT